MELKVKADDGQQIWLSKEDIYHGSLILVNAAYAYLENTGNKQYLDEILQPVLKQREKDISTKDTTRIETALPEIAERSEQNSEEFNMDIYDMKLQRRAVILLNELMEKMHGWEHIVPVSAWRPHKEQQSIWDTSMRESGREFTETYVAVPGHSEHETGLAIDLGLKQDVIDFIRPEFPYEGICQRFRQLAPKYGFIERYPKGKEEVTGIGQEPWHFRYVGMPHAEIMTEKGMVLEEYIEFLRGYEYGKNPYRYCSQGKEIWISYLNAGQSEQICLDADHKTPRVISGNNVDGFVITEWSTCRG